MQSFVKRIKVIIFLDINPFLYRTLKLEIVRIYQNFVKHTKLLRFLFLIDVSLCNRTLKPFFETK